MLRMVVIHVLGKEEIGKIVTSSFCVQSTVDGNNGRNGPNAAHPVVEAAVPD